MFTWVTVGIAIVAFRIGKWGPNIGTFVKIAVVVLFTVLFIAFLVQHGRPAGASTAADLNRAGDPEIRAVRGGRLHRRLLRGGRGAAFAGA